ncbi:hypothetical protein M0811_10720 [Anaeramoeba ignava]|uniref:Uncharacterized protein n=1 Tax=Anaeramoeba ignava TaxID=1746090 RepID=A0A9Q0LEZ3_ANAIG|nr:hypothetical protein M0811_10720 [Anaeramoeba ignava]
MKFCTGWGNPIFSIIFVIREILIKSTYSFCHFVRIIILELNEENNIFKTNWISKEALDSFDKRGIRK